MATTGVFSLVTGTGRTQPRTSCAETQPVSSTAPRPRFLQNLVLLGLALVTSSLLYLSFFPVDCGFLGWFALVPWLVLVRSQARPRLLYLVSWLAGLAFNLLVLAWLRVADPRMNATWVGLAIYCACYFALALWLLRWLERRTPLPLVLTLPVVWTGLEMIRADFCSGFSWYLLAHTQHDFLPLIQVSDLTGAYGVSFLVAAVNALLFEILWQRDWFRSLVGAAAAPRQGRLGLLVQAMGLLMVVLGVLGYGAWRLSQDSQEPGPRLALIQGNMPQGVRNAASAPPGQKQMSASLRSGLHFFDLCDLAARYRPDLVVWPETSFPGEWQQIAGDHPRREILEPWQEQERECELAGKGLVRRWPTAHLLGLTVGELGADNRPRRYNSALLLDAQGRTAGRYDKSHRVPFGEYVPLRDWIPLMNRLAPYDYDYEVLEGAGHPALPVVARDNRRYTFGANICYEDTDPSISRPYVTDGQPGVDFLVNISNDGWFDGTAEHEQHLAISRFRAIECRRGLARAVNMGISAVIDGNGRILRPRTLPGPDDVGLLGVNPAAPPLVGLPWRSLHWQTYANRVWSIPEQKSDWKELPVREWAQYKHVPGVLLATIPIDSRSSFYARRGDWLPWSCLGLLGLMVVVSRFSPVRKAAGATTHEPTIANI